jgi:hypothetical protein
VHAAANVAHLDLPQFIGIDGSKVARALQRHLPSSIVVRRSEAAPCAEWVRASPSLIDAWTPPFEPAPAVVQPDELLKNTLRPRLQDARSNASWRRYR